MKLNAEQFLNRVKEILSPQDIDHHESDLYIRKNPASTELVEQYEYKNLVTEFIDNIEKVPWYDIPFVYHE